jgi:hypothetical protein
MTKPRRRQTTAQTLGGMIVGFDYQVFRTTPPPHELVQKGQPVRGTSGEDGTEFEVVFPDEATSAGSAAGRGDPDPIEPPVD